MGSWGRVKELTVVGIFDWVGNSSSCGFPRAIACDQSMASFQSSRILLFDHRDHFYLRIKPGIEGLGLRPHMQLVKSSSARPMYLGSMDTATCIRIASSAYYISYSKCNIFILINFMQISLEEQWVIFQICYDIEKALTAHSVSSDSARLFPLAP